MKRNLLGLSAVVLAVAFSAFASNTKVAGEYFIVANTSPTASSFTVASSAPSDDCGSTGSFVCKLRTLSSTNYQPNDPIPSSDVDVILTKYDN